ncbi:MAG: HDOD domain-containing protein [Glaciecola sp.]
MSMTPLIKFANKSFTLPDTCLKLREILDDPRKDNDDIAQVMSHDPSLSAKVLKLANSSLFRFPSQVTSIAKALSIIGGEAAYNISMAETANLAFKSVQNEQIDFSSFWEKSVATGLIARTISQQLQQRGSERFFVMGILMHFAELVCATKLPLKYMQYKTLLDTTLPLEAQRSVYGFTFASCSGIILSSWRLPENLYMAMSNLSLFDHQALSIDEAVLYLAATMAAKQEGQDLIKANNLHSQAVECIGLEDYEYDIILQFAQSETGKIAQLIN